MKFVSSILASLLLILSFRIEAQTVKDLAIQATAVVTKSPPSISLRWPLISSGVTKYTIYRKAKDEQTWGTVKFSPKASDTMWTDTDVSVGKVYEYNIQKLNGASVTGITYILSGIEVPVVHNRGSALVVIEKTLAAAVSSEFDNYLMDIAADGWKVFVVQVSKTDSVTFVKREIKRFHKMAGGLTSLILIGHVPVPYSGNFGGNPDYPQAPDAHPDHVGCWPADTYYAIDYDFWADSDSNTVGGRTANQNVPGDGKFDNVEIPGTVRYYMGRIDLSDMPAFGLSEAELTKRYFKKAHDFRYKTTQTVEKGVIDENFGVSTGAFSVTGWRNFSAMFGPKNIIEGDLLTNCSTQNLLFAFGAGGGSYNSCGGVCSTTDLVTSKPAVFNMLFGSYFGDWDNTNNLLRAPLASPENGLTNAWSGRPYWQNHSMALGDPIGYSALVTQNNRGLYSYGIFANLIHVGLMGDPTLRLHIIAPPTAVSAKDSFNKTIVNLKWTSSAESSHLGYYIYRASSPYGNYFPLNSTPVTSTAFADNSPFQGTNYYLVKTVKLTTSASGSYFNTSYGAATVITGMKGQPAQINSLLAQTVMAYPNPANNQITFQFTNYNKSSEVEIFNIHGQKVRSQSIQLDGNFMTESIDLSALNKGFYIMRAGNSSCKFMKN